MKISKIIIMILDIGYEITENNNDDEIIKTQQVQVTRKKSDTETEDTKHQVPETRRVVQGSQAKNDKNDNNLTPTDTIQMSDTKIDDGEIIQPVPKMRRMVQKTMLKEEAKSTPTSNRYDWKSKRECRNTAKYPKY
jgi:hypothetical protein